jgi:hypothetical protein
MFCDTPSGGQNNSRKSWGSWLEIEKEMEKEKESVYWLQALPSFIGSEPWVKGQETD